MRLYCVTLEATTPVGPLNIQTKREFYVDVTEIDDMVNLALAEGWHFTAVPVITRSAENVVQAFKRTIEIDKDF